MSDIDMSATSGGALVAMKGKNCVAIAADKRFGNQLSIIGMDFERVFPFGQKLFIGIPGSVTDTQTVPDKLRFRTNLYELRENRKPSPYVFSTMVSNLLYEHRFGNFYVTPVIAALDDKNEPYICRFDSIGSRVIVDDFVVNGLCKQELIGMCETMWKKDMNPDQLFETISQALVNGFDRNAICGWGAKVYLIEPTKVTIRHLRTRMD